MRFRGHESFFIRKGWLYKGINAIQQNPAIFTSSYAMDELGIGSNMVRSLRYWMQATGLSIERRLPNKAQRGQYLSEMGQVIWDNDRYMEETGTWWLIHYNLAKNEDYATTWYVFFNMFKMHEFTKGDIIKQIIKRYPEKADSEKTLDSDVECLLSTYIKRSVDKANFDPESNMNCPLGDLDILRYVDKKNGIIQRKTIDKNMIPSLIILAAICDLYDKEDIILDKELSINKLLNGNGLTCGIGNLFSIDLIQFLGILYELENMGYLRVIRTSGLDVIKISTKISFLDCINEYFITIN